MRAAVLVEPGRIEIEDAPVPEPGPGEVRVRLEGCGVCGSNLAPWQGQPWFNYPFAPGDPGHEGWGRIEALGPGVIDRQEGDRVALLGTRSFAECDVAPAASTIPLPAALDGVPFPGEPLGCAFNVHARSGIERGQTVAVIGVGFLGAVLVRLAAEAGAHVIAVSRRPFARALAERLGAARTLGMEDPRGVVAAVEQATQGRLCDRVIEAAGKQATLDLAGELTGIRGRLIIAGYHQDGPRQVNLQLWNWRGLDVVNAHEREPALYVRGVAAAVAAVEAGRLAPAALCTHVFPLERLHEALETTASRPDGFLKAIVRP